MRAPRVPTVVAVALSSLFLGVVAASSGTSASAASPPQFGSLSNFDVFNDTGQVTHGFEIELDGITPSQVVYEFGAPYERYGNPVIVSRSYGTDVLYESTYSATTKQYAVGTPVAPTPITPTAGHACWTGGSANYPTAGCEHFGLGLTATPTNVSNYWLVADPSHPGHLLPFGGGVPLPAPRFSVAPPSPSNPNQKPLVHAQVQAPQPENGQQLGNAIWVKVFVIESASAADLGHLVTGDGQVPSKVTETETEWSLLQAGSGGGLPQDLTEGGQMQSKSMSVTRRFEFYAYTGAYDPSSHEATPINDAAPSPGELGNLIGVQMAAIDLAQAGKIVGDHTAPRAYLTARPPATTKATSFRFTFRATDPDNRTFTFYCSLDWAIPKPCTTPWTVRQLRVGKHVFRVFAADLARNASQPVSTTWTVIK